MKIIFQWNLGKTFKLIRELAMNIFFLFDKNCSFCRDGIRVLKTFNYDFKINFIACQDYNLNYDKQLDCQQSSYFIICKDSEVKIFAGASGVNHLLRRISNNKYLKYFGYLYLIPPMNILEDFGYYLIKKNRNRIRKLYSKS